MELNTYNVGRCYPNWKTGNVLTQIDYSGSTLGFVYGIPNPTQQEIQTILEGDMMVTFSIVNDIPFILVNFNNYGWMDASFYPGYYSKDCLDRTFEEGTGVPFLVLIVDTNTGMLMRMRLSGLSNSFSNNLFKECRKIYARGILCKEEVNRRIDMIYKQFPKSEDLLSKSKAKWVTGLISIDGNDLGVE